MPVKDQAAYMRDYRAKRAKAHVVAAVAKDPDAKVFLNVDRPAEFATDRILFLEGEVVRLKRALAQANRDAILRKVNRTGRE